LKTLKEYIANPFDLGRDEANLLETLREKYPYFQALHILIAKCHHNQNTFGFNKNLKLAALYAGDREVLFKFIKAEKETAELLAENKPLLKEEDINEHFSKHERDENLFVKLENPDIELIAEVEETIPFAEPSEIVPEIEINASPEIIAGDAESLLEIQPNEIIETAAEPNLPEIDVEEIAFIELEEEPEIDLVDALPETLEVKSDELDFYSWLDNFSSSEVKNISEQTVNTIPSSDDEPNEEMEELIQLPVDFEEENEPQEAVYNPAAWAEIAYDIQAFVKTSDTAAEKRSEELKPSKYEIDDLLDRFIKKNPSISRTKTEFYKPENMARKSEEFHAEVASESLAQLFFKQGQLHTALEMYEKLLLQNPDKKDIFAARIKSIKEELINRL
jgi:hypothetical protein